MESAQDILVRLLEHLNSQQDERGVAICQELLGQLNDSANLLLIDILKEQQEVISSPIRFNGVSVAAIRRVFEKRGIRYDLPF
jgi:hypothetical protein